MRPSPPDPEPSGSPPREAEPDRHRRPRDGRGAALGLALAATCAGAALALGWGWWSEAKESQEQLAALVHQHRVATERLAERDASLERAETERGAQIARQQEHVARLGEEVARLTAELEQALGQNQALTDALADAQHELAVVRERAADTPSIEALPEGLRLALVAFHELLRADGVEGMRILRTGGIADGEMVDVQLLDHDPESLRSTLYKAARMWVTLDRQSGSLELRFFEGFQSSGSEDVAFPEEGHAVRIPAVDGREWERRLPYLVRSEGVWPDPDAEERPPIHPAELAVWRDRLGQLLRHATTDRALKVKGIRTLHEGRFLDLAVAGYENNLLASYLEAARAAVLVDDTAGLVYLELFDGRMRDEHGETRIGERGYRMLLEGVEPAVARRLMMGLVVAVE